jgi:biofilm protein TabA
MILDSLENASKYVNVHPRFKMAFDFLNNTDLLALPFGKIELQGTDVFVIVAEQIGKTVDEARMETHNKYIDIQVPIGATETMGWVAGNRLECETDPYDEQKDVSFFADKASNLLQVQPFEFAVFFPEDGHQPGIAVGVHKKIIVKVLV